VLHATVAVQSVADMCNSLSRTFPIQWFQVLTVAARLRFGGIATVLIVTLQMLVAKSLGDAAVTVVQLVAIGALLSRHCCEITQCCNTIPQLSFQCRSRTVDYSPD